MRFLCIAERELRAGARQKRTHRIRWITAAAFLALLLWLAWVFDGFRAPQIFTVFSAITFFYCLVIGTAGTADCLSSEKREGTIGLLFLTNLNGPEIIGGKLCSSALNAAYGLFAIFPLLALQMLVGGITLSHFWRTVLSLASAIFFSVASGFLASSVCVRQFTAIALATGLAGFFSAGLMGVAAVARSFGGAKPWTDGLAIFSPLYSFIAANGRSTRGWKHYWWSLAAVTGVSLIFLILATLRVSLAWRDRTTGLRIWSSLKLVQRWRQQGNTGRAALRRRLLAINPFYWLGGRHRVSSPIFMLLTAIIVVCASCIMAPYFGRTLRTGTFNVMLGHLFAWVWAGLAIHALVLYYGAMAASQRLAEDKQTGALELVLSTPTSVRSISNGLWLAYGRRMFFPALIAILVHCFFIWQIGIMAVLDPPSTKLPPGTTPGQLLWHALLNRPLGGVPLDWGFIVVSRIVLLALVLLMLVWLTLGWVGRWLGLRMKRPGFAPMTSLALVFLPPILLFSLACYCVSKWHLDRLPARLFAPLMMWVAVGIGAGHCLIVSLWAANRLRRDFRSVVTSHFQPAPVRPWWRPTRRSLLRIGAGGLATGAALLMIVLSFYGYQNWQSRRAWTAFQKELKQRNESLDVAVLLPGPVPENQNFALTPVFKSWVHSTEAHSAANQLFDHLTQLNASASQNGNGSAGTEWIRQMFAPLDDYSTWIAPGAGLPGNAKRAEFANAVLRGLKPYDATIRALASATRLPYFQTFTNRGVPTVLQPARNENGALAGLQMLLQARACALLANNRSAEAAEDLLAGLQLARLARQIPDAESPALTQTMLTRSLQPLWEGMVENRWTASQLAAFQAELSGFNLLVDYTNVVRRVVIANMVLWQEFAHRTSGPISFPAGDEYRTQVWEIQPRAWWLENCIELYRVGQNAIGRVDVAGVHIRNDTTYSDLSGLSLDYAASSLLQQAWWSGASPTLVVFAQTSVNQAIIACALERFRLATGKYPKTLEQLVPEYLPFVPNDVVRGRPMLYQNSSEGRFILRSVGPNGIDDRKFPISDDWLWSFPTNMVPAAATNRFQTK